MYLLDRGDSGLSKLSPAATSVLTVLAMSTDMQTLETWVPQEALARRTGLSVATIKRALVTLDEYLKFSRYRANGIKVYRLHLPGLEPTGAVASSAPAEPAKPFDVLAYVAALTEPVAGIAPDRVRVVVKYHWLESPNDYWRRGDKHSPAWLGKCLPAMAQQYDKQESKPATATSRKAQYVEPQPAWVPTTYPRKGEKIA